MPQGRLLETEGAHVYLAMTTCWSSCGSLRVLDMQCSAGKPRLTCKVSVAKLLIPSQVLLHDNCARILFLGNLE